MSDRHISVALARYLRWYVHLCRRSAHCPSVKTHADKQRRLGVKTRIFHLGDYRRATIPFGEDMPDDYFYVNGKYARFRLEVSMMRLKQCLASASSVLLRQKIVRKCREDIYHFLNHENGQIAIYDAVNPIASGRRSLAKEFAKHDIEVGFLPEIPLSQHANISIARHSS